MRYLRYLALLSIFLLPATFSHAAQVSVGVGVVPAPYAYPAYGPPVCTYGYYSYPPYACAPYGYYSPGWFTGGVFIGAGPWFRAGYGYRGYYPYRGGYYYGRPVYGPGYRPAVPYRVELQSAAAIAQASTATSPVAFMAVEASTVAVTAKS